MEIRFLVCYGLTYLCKLRWCFDLVATFSNIVIILVKYNGAVIWSSWFPRSIDISALVYDTGLVKPIISILG